METEQTSAAAQAAKERVEQELLDLNEKIVKLATFLYGPALKKANLSRTMIMLEKDQLHVMQQYSEILEQRLDIWGKSEEEI